MSWLAACRSLLTRQPKARRGSHHALGASGERIAARYLRKRGYRVLARNLRVPAGEADLICAAPDRRTIVLVEVKTRSSADAAFPEANVNRSKQRQITRVARAYVAAKQVEERPLRFDIVSVLLEGRAKPVVEHFVNAFEPVFR